MEEKIAIITGASRGIGEAAALLFSKLGYYLILISRNSSTLEKTKQKIEKAGGTATFIALDISNPDEVKQCIQAIMEKNSRIDVLLNNAGVAFPGTSEIGDEEVLKMINTNLLGAIYVANNVAKHMKKQGFGYIFNLASIGGKNSRPTMGGYNASKFGLVGYSDALFKEMLPFGVKVTAICPGMVNTNMAQSIISNTRLSTNDLIPLDDVLHSIQYLLALGKNTAVSELVMNCSPMLNLEEKAKLECIKNSEKI